MSGLWNHVHWSITKQFGAPPVWVSFPAYPFSGVSFPHNTFSNVTMVVAQREIDALNYWWVVMGVVSNKPTRLSDEWVISADGTQKCCDQQHCLDRWNHQFHPCHAASPWPLVACMPPFIPSIRWGSSSSTGWRTGRPLQPFPMFKLTFTLFVLNPYPCSHCTYLHWRRTTLATCMIGQRTIYTTEIESVMHALSGDPPVIYSANPQSILLQSLHRPFMSFTNVLLISSEVNPPTFTPDSAGITLRTPAQCSSLGAGGGGGPLPPRPEWDFPIFPITSARDAVDLIPLVTKVRSPLWHWDRTKALPLSHCKLIMRD